MSFEIIVDCIMALGALATAATFVLVLINQKGTQKQIDSLSQMAEMFSRHYQLERIQAGSNIYPKIQISLKDDLMWGLKIQVKNNSYPVEVYRIIIYEPRTHLDIKLKPKSEYIQVRQGETKCILPGELSRQSLYAFGASIRIYLIYNPQIQISAESETKRSIFREKDKTKRSKKESAQHSKSRNKSFVMTSVSAL